MTDLYFLILDFPIYRAYTFNVARFHRKQLNESKGLAALLFLYFQDNGLSKKYFFHHAEYLLFILFALAFLFADDMRGVSGFIPQ